MLGICKGVYIHSRPTASPIGPSCVQDITNTTAPTCVQGVCILLLQHHLYMYMYMCYMPICMYTNVQKLGTLFWCNWYRYYHYYYIIYFDVIDTYYHYLILKHTLSYIIVFTHARSIICRSCALDIISYFIILLFYLQH